MRIGGEARSVCSKASGSREPHRINDVAEEAVTWSSDGMEFWPVSIRSNRSRTGGKPVRNRPRDQSAAASLFQPILSDRV
eukprot:1565360-Rhodomonas_salina.1